MRKMKPVIILMGPTAVGKSSVAVELASDLGSDIISADSRQIYRGMDIGTAKPDLAERKRVAHHLIDVVKPDEMFSAGRFKTMADAIITRLHQEGQVPVIVGGTGLYVKALVYGLWQGAQAEWDLRKKLREKEKLHGSGYLHEMLQAVDPESAARIQPRDVNKLIRAIEVFEQTGQPLSVFHHKHLFKERPYHVIMIGLRRLRSDLYSRIDQRVEEMVDRGLLDEVRGLFKKGYAPELPSMKGLGYRHMVNYLIGKYDLNEAVQRLKRDTRRYAKRQFTWFNRDPAIRWVDLQPSDGNKEAYSKVHALIHLQEELMYAKG
jgi:tRNA dimethylallyltransferase